MDSFAQLDKQATGGLETFRKKLVSRMSLYSVTDREDLAHDAILRALSAKRKNSKRLPGYVWATARSVGCNHKRDYDRTHTETVSDIGNEGIIELEYDFINPVEVEDVVERNEELVEARSAWLRIKDMPLWTGSTRTIGEYAKLVAESGMTQEEIAQAWGVSVGAIKSALWRFRHQ